MIRSKTSVVIVLAFCILAAAAKSPRVKLSYPHSVRRELPLPDPLTVDSVGAQLSLDFQLTSKNETPTTPPPLVDLASSSPLPTVVEGAWTSDTAVVANTPSAPDTMSVNETTSSDEPEDLRAADVGAPVLRASDMQCTVFNSRSATPTQGTAWMLSCYDIPKATLDAVTFVQAQDCRTVDGVRECTVALPV